MSRLAADASVSRWLGAGARARLRRQLESALQRARATGAPALASATAAIDRHVDPAAVVAASRRPPEQWFCLEQPDRDGSAVAALGCVRLLEARGPDRFAELARRWRTLVAAALCDPPDGPPGCGLAAVGGFAFASDGGSSAAWKGCAPASLVVPEVSLVRPFGLIEMARTGEIAIARGRGET